MSTPVVALDGLTVRFGRRVILDALSGSLSGRAIGLLGPNGAGKTTLLHTLLGFHSPAAGGARILGHDIVRERREVRSLIGYMPENDSFIAGMSAVRFVRMFGELSGLPPSAALERAHETLFYVGLNEARYRKLETFSLGMKQRVKLAQALVHGPRLLFLDEPTNGLDPPSRLRMLALIREIRDSGEMTLILSSHLLRDVDECCEEVLILKQGRIVESCDIAAERRTNRAFLELETHGDNEAFLTAAHKVGCESAPGMRGAIKMVLPSEFDTRELFRLAAAHGVQIRKLGFKRDSLEDIFLKAMEEV